jgi:hypothetical protein
VSWKKPTVAGLASPAHRVRVDSWELARDGWRFRAYCTCGWSGGDRAVQHIAAEEATEHARDNR